MTPTIAQARNRMLSGHKHALQRIAQGLNPFGDLRTASEFRGARKVMKTLFRWGAVTYDPGSPSGLTLTEFGRQLAAVR